ncbi:hypothetical protein F4825DRAFT_409692 [Nemania diffusa]|nr:hypothetical protein F4825DRAFT_409692 [Nemania diffusa]
MESIELLVTMRIYVCLLVNTAAGGLYSLGRFHNALFFLICCYHCYLACHNCLLLHCLLVASVTTNLSILSAVCRVIRRGV